jgi:nitrogenase molybdenum-iron protein alpha/beta subunit
VKRVFAFKPFADCAVMPVFDFKVSVSVVAKLYEGKNKEKIENAENAEVRGEREEVKGGGV